MQHRGVVALVAAVAVAALLAAPAVAQEAGAAQPPRTSWGAPDLGGVWDFRTITPLERPEELSEQDVLTDEQAAEREARAIEQNVDRPPPPGSTGGYNRFWVDTPSFVDNTRTSLIVDPPDGRLPALQPGVSHQIGSLGEDLQAERPIRYRVGGAGVDGPEDRGIAERCILGFANGPPLLPGGYNQNVQVFQTPDHVVILNEMVHDPRIVPLDGRPHLPGDLRQWNGDARGYWEGDTLVIESTNFSDLVPSYNPTVASAMGSGEHLRLVERLTRVSADTLLYEYTVDDPVTFTRPFTVALPMRFSEVPMFEYACHEGNYGLLNILRGAREDDRAAAMAEAQDPR
ncbi:MAG: hypothetical protein OXH75_15070 [Acidobacteria bacterium]|nr:hypothetical protein [Acidobacteriota bacterium]